MAANLSSCRSPPSHWQLPPLQFSWYCLKRCEAWARTDCLKQCGSLADGAWHCPHGTCGAQSRSLRKTYPNHWASERHMRLPVSAPYAMMHLHHVALLCWAARTEAKPPEPSELQIFFRMQPSELQVLLHLLRCRLGICSLVASAALQGGYLAAHGDDWLAPDAS